MTIGIDAHNLEQMRGGAAFRYLANLLEYWKKEKNHTFILYFKDFIPAITQIESENFTKKLLESRLKSNAFFVHFLLPRAARKDKVDILFCPYYVSPAFYRGEFIVAIHDIYYEADPRHFSWQGVWDKILLKIISRRSAKRAKKIITISEFSKNEIVKYYKVNPEKIIVTYLAAENKFIRLNADKKQIDTDFKEKYGIKDNFILYIGAIFNRRHIPELIAAFEKISDKLPNYELVVVGRNHTNPRIDIDALAKNANKKREMIKIIPDLAEDDIVSIYNSASLTVYLSDYEGFGLPVIESMACGTPVVTTNRASLPEVGGDAAICVQNPNNIEEIAEKILGGLTDENLYQELIRRGLENVKRFSWEECARETLNAML